MPKGGVAQSSMLWWNGLQGLAYCDGVQTVLRSAVDKPCFPGIDVAEIDFAWHVRIIREERGAWRDMTLAEIGTASAMLQRMAVNARAAVTEIKQ